MTDEIAAVAGPVAISPNFFVASRLWSSNDRRLLGAFIGGILLRGTKDFHDVSLDDPALNRGWWDVEQMHRWTSGDAVLPVPTGTLTVEIRLAGGCRYPLAASVVIPNTLAA